MVSGRAALLASGLAAVWLPLFGDAGLAGQGQSRGPGLRVAVGILGAPEAPGIGIACQDVGNAHLGITDEGSIGFDSRGRGCGFLFPVDHVPTQNLFRAGLLVGQDPPGGPPRVSDNIDNGDLDFFPLQVVGLREPGILGDQDGLARFDDIDAEDPLGVSVRQLSYAYAPGRGLEDFVILRYDVRNVGTSPLAGISVGLFVDWDVGDFASNKGGYDGARSLGLIANDVDFSPPRIVGVRVLRTPDDPDGADAYRVFADPPDPRDVPDSVKYEWLAGGFVNTRDLTLGDKAHVIATGPFALAPGDSVQVAFAVVGGEGLADVQANADSAQAAFDAPRGPRVPAVALAVRPVRSRAVAGGSFGWEADVASNDTSRAREVLVRVRARGRDIPPALLNYPNPLTLGLGPRQDTTLAYTLRIPRGLTLVGEFDLTTSIEDPPTGLPIAEATHIVEILDGRAPFDLRADDGSAEAFYVLGAVTGPQDWFAVEYPVEAFTEIGIGVAEEVEIAGVGAYAWDTGGPPGDPFAALAVAPRDPETGGPDTFHPLASRSDVSAPGEPGFALALFPARPGLPAPQHLYALAQLPPGQTIGSGDVVAVGADSAGPPHGRSLFSRDGATYHAVPTPDGNIMLRIVVRLPERSGEAVQGAAPGPLVAGLCEAAPLPASAGRHLLTPPLLEVSPSPAPASAVLALRIPEGGARASLALYDLRGHLVRRLLEDVALPAGTRQILWDGRDAGGRSLRSGLYLAHAEVGGRRETRRIVVRGSPLAR